MKRKIITLLTTVTMMICMIGCGSAFDAQGYVQGFLDANIKGEFKTYAKLCDAKTSDLEKTYQKSLDEIINNWTIGTSINDTSKELIKESLVTILSKTDYTVNAATKHGTSYKVKVDIKPLRLDISADKMNTINENAMNQYTEAYPDEDTTNEEAYYEIWSAMFSEYLTELAENPTYDEQNTVTVEVLPDSDGKYGISKGDQRSLTSALLVTSETPAEKRN